MKLKLYFWNLGLAVLAAALSNEWPNAIWLADATWLLWGFWIFVFNPIMFLPFAFSQDGDDRVNTIVTIYREGDVRTQGARLTKSGVDRIHNILDRSEPNVMPNEAYVATRVHLRNGQVVRVVDMFNKVGEFADKWGNRVTDPRPSGGGVAEFINGPKLGERPRQEEW